VTRSHCEQKHRLLEDSSACGMTLSVARIKDVPMKGERILLSSTITDNHIIKQVKTFKHFGIQSLSWKTKSGK
jgi:hypothetical protein